MTTGFFEAFLSETVFLGFSVRYNQGYWINGRAVICSLGCRWAGYVAGDTVLFVEG
ncbi:hypothetical protein Enr17x_41830 [Gimesia fumaroli]|uniref:Uncharacterized protein n=1 Tax=Gimesia fumaroli TaxID=2527976 RepID=A0A518IGB8_9PLAN|nr:hypothetical protein Enr17x_41830 [Gimesia fumaroli]